MAYIYKITNHINNKLYIGTTKYKVQQRWNEHVSRYRNLLQHGNLKYPLYLAFAKYGIENFTIEAIEECDECEMFDREKYYIELYNTYGTNGYNATIGGEGTLRLTSEDKQAIIDTYTQCKTIAETQRRTGRNAETIHNVLNASGISTNTFITEQDEKKIVQLYADGNTINDISIAIGKCTPSILRVLNKHDIYTAAQMRTNSELCIDHKLICSLRDNHYTIRQIYETLHEDYEFVTLGLITKILTNYGYILSRELEENLDESLVLEYYQQCKSIKQTAQYFHVGRFSMTKFLKRHQIFFDSKNCPTEVSLLVNDGFVCFQTLIDCAKFVHKNYLQDYTSVRGIRDNISKAMRSDGQYAGLYFFNGDKSMVKIKQTEDTELLGEIMKQLEENNYICPCSIRADPKLDKCMCQGFRDIINKQEPGVYECACGRYIATITEE